MNAQGVGAVNRRAGPCTTVALIDELRWMSDDDDGALFGTTYSEIDDAAFHASSTTSSGLSGVTSQA